MSKVRILYVSRNEKDYAHLQYIASESQFDIELEYVSNHLRCLDRIKKNDFDICIIDNYLKVISGVELVEKIKYTGFKGPVLLVVSEADKELGDTALSAGATDYLIKDHLDIDSFARAVRYALGMIRIYNQKAEEDKEKAMIVSLELLSEASKVLSSSFDYSETVEQTAKLIVSRMADWCTVEVMTDKGIDIIAVEHIIPLKTVYIKELRERFPPTLKDTFGPGRVVRTKKTEYYRSIDDLTQKDLAKNNKQLDLLRQLGFGSYISAPIAIRGNVVGALSLVSTIHSRYSETDVTLAEELAVRIATAIENSKLYKESRRSEEIFRRLVESNTIGLSIFNFSGSILAANEVTLKLIGYSREEVLAKSFNWLNLYPEELRPLISISRDELDKTGVASTKERELIHKDGKRVPVLIGSVLLDKEEGTALAFIVDITSQKQLEQQKDEFISIASHELKTPLTSQKVYVELLRKLIIKESPQTKNKEYVDKISEQTEKLIKLVNDLLDVSRIQAGKMVIKREQVDLNILIAKVTENIQAVTKNYEIEISGKLSKPVLCDEHRIEQVISNLLTNAIKYSPVNKKVNINLSEMKDSAKVCIEDFGIGITHENQKKLFGRFVRVEGVERQFPGFGLGLYIASEIVRRHNGQISVKSQVGKGSTFCFTIPFASSEITNNN